MLKKSAFAILAALTVTAPVFGSDVAQAQSNVALKCWHDGNPKHFRPECRDPLKDRVEVKKVEIPSTDPRNRVEPDVENLFDEMMRDSGGGAGGGGGGR